MIFSYALTIPTNTQKSAPVTQTETLTFGILRNVSVFFPPGCANLVHLTVLYHEHQIIPINPEGSISWDNDTITWPEHIKIFTQPFQIKLVAWNLDTSFDHEIFIHLNILPPAAPPPMSTLEKIGRIFNPVIDMTAEITE